MLFVDSSSLTFRHSCIDQLLQENILIKTANILHADKFSISDTTVHKYSICDFSDFNSLTTSLNNLSSPFLSHLDLATSCTSVFSFFNLTFSFIVGKLRTFGPLIFHSFGYVMKRFDKSSQALKFLKNFQDLRFCFESLLR